MRRRVLNKSDYIWRVEGQKFMYFVYLLKCKNGNIYTGITTDIERRFKEHRDGKGGHYTKSVGVIEIIRTEQYNDRSAALKREAEIKSWKREKKMDLIKSKHGS